TGWSVICAERTTATRSPRAGRSKSGRTKSCVRCTTTSTNASWPAAGRWSHPDPPELHTTPRVHHLPPAAPTFTVPHTRCSAANGRETRPVGLAMTSPARRSVARYALFQKNRRGRLDGPGSGRAVPQHESQQGCQAHFGESRQDRPFDP